MALVIAATTESEIALGVKDHLAQQRDAVAGKEREITAAEAELERLIDEDQRLVATMNENRRQAAAPEPQAPDYETVEAWHAAARKWRVEREGLDEAFAPIERERTNLATQRIPAARRKITELRFALAQLEFDLAKDELTSAQHQVDLLQVRVRRRQASLRAAGEARAA